MSLRQKTRKDDPPVVEENEDIESSSPLIDDNATKKATDHITNNMNIVRLVRRRVVQLLLGKEDTTDNDGGILSFLQDIVIGLTLGVILMSFLIFLDHRDVIHIQSAHKIRETAYNMLTNPETRTLVEEATNLKFITKEVYETNLEEIDSFASKTSQYESKVKGIEADITTAKKEYESLTANYNDLFLAAGLDKYCALCLWSGKTNCDTRVAYLKSNYNIKQVEALLGVKESAPQCFKE
jgi:hypothetical protein